MDNLAAFNLFIAAFFMVCYLYQLFYICVSTFKKPKDNKNYKLNRTAVMISARNEQAVISKLIESIKSQHYPKKLLDIYVVADNCTDQTAITAKNAGAIVYERFNRAYVGKGYALEFLFDKVIKANKQRPYDAYIILDADNILDENFVFEINKTFCSGYQIVTSYRNSKNYGTNWISAGHSLWFLRESRQLNSSRMLLNTSCAVSGTGFLVSNKIIERQGGWKHFLLTEDIEFTIDNILKGEKIGYSPKAVLYDEQPTSFSQSFNQRLRWAKGNLQVYMKYAKELFTGLFSSQGFACFDMTMTIMPAFFVTVVSVAVNLIATFAGVITNSDIILLMISVFKTLLSAYLMLFFAGAVATVTEWKNINCKPVKKVLYCFSFPLFMLTYIPISIIAVFKKVKWKPIYHTAALSLNDIKNEY